MSVPSTTPCVCSNSKTQTVQTFSLDDKKEKKNRRRFYFILLFTKKKKTTLKNNNNPPKNNNNNNNKTNRDKLESGGATTTAKNKQQQKQLSFPSITTLNAVIVPGLRPLGQQNCKPKSQLFRPEVQLRLWHSPILEDWLQNSDG